jgi:hypothetical protein
MIAPNIAAFGRIFFLRFTVSLNALQLRGFFARQRHRFPVDPGDARSTCRVDCILGKGVGFGGYRRLDRCRAAFQ